MPKTSTSARPTLEVDPLTPVIVICTLVTVGGDEKTISYGPPSLSKVPAAAEVPLLSRTLALVTWSYGWRS